MRHVFAITLCALLVACAQEAPEVEGETDSGPLDQFAPVRTALVSAASRTAGGVLTVGLQPATCGDSRLPGAFGRYWPTLARESLSDTGLSFLAPGDVEALLREAGERSVDLYDPESAPVFGSLEAPTAAVIATYWPDGDSAVRVAMTAKLLNTGADISPPTSVVFPLESIPLESSPVFPCRMIPRGAILCATGTGAGAIHAAIADAVRRSGVSIIQDADVECTTLARGLLSGQGVPPRLVSEPVASAVIAAQSWVRIVDETRYTADAGGRVVVASIGESGAAVQEFPLRTVEIGFQRDRETAERTAIRELVRENADVWQRAAERAGRRVW